MIIFKYESISFFYIIITSNLSSLVFAFDFDVSFENEKHKTSSYRHEEIQSYSRHVSHDFNKSSFIPLDNNHLTSEPISRTTTIEDTLVKFEMTLASIKKMSKTEFFKNSIITFGNKIYESISEVDINPECLSSLLKIYDGIQKKQIWALKCK